MQMSSNCPCLTTVSAFICFLLINILCFVYGNQVSFAGGHINIRPVITVDEEYTDNLFLADSEKEEDIVTLISPGILIEAADRRNSLRFSYNAGYSLYKRFSEYNAWRHNSLLNASLGILKHSRMQFSNSFVLTEEPEEEIENRAEEDSGTSPRQEAETETVRRSRDRYYKNSSRISLRHPFGKADFFSLAYTLDILKNEDLTVRDEIRHRPSFFLSYWPVPGRLGTDFSISYSRNDISDAEDNPGYLEEYLNPSVYVKYWWIPGRLLIQPGLMYEKGLSYDNRQTGDEGIRDEADDNRYESIRPSLKLFWQISRHNRAETDVYYNKSITYTDEGLSDPSDDFQNAYASFTLTRQFSRKLEAFVTYTLSRTEYRGKGAGTDEDSEDYTVHEPSLGIRYILAEGLPLHLRIGYLVRNKEITGKESAITLNGDLGTWKFCRYGSVTFRAASGYNEDHFGAENLGFGFYYNADMKAEYVFSHYLTGNMYGRYLRNRYLDNEEKGGDTRNDRTWELGCGLTYQSEKWWFMRLDYIYRNVNSTASEDSYEDNRIILKMGLSPGKGIRIW